MADAYQGRPINQHSEDQPRAFEIGGPRGLNQVNSVEDDVRHEAKADGPPNLRGAAETIEAEVVYEGPSLDGFLEVQIQLIVHSDIVMNGVNVGGSDVRVDDNSQSEQEYCGDDPHD